MGASLPLTHKSHSPDMKGWFTSSARRAALSPPGPSRPQGLLHVSVSERGLWQHARPPREGCSMAPTALSPGRWSGHGPRIGGEEPRVAAIDGNDGI